MADETKLGPDGQPIVVAGTPGAVSVETVGSHPVVYDGSRAEIEEATPDTVSGALQRLFEKTAENVLPTATFALDAPLDQGYGERSDARETAALEREAADLDEQDKHAALADQAKAVVGDVAKGVFLEGGQAVLSGAKKAVNETTDLVEHIADQIPGPIVAWGDTDGDPATDNGVRVEFASGAEFKKANTGIKRFLPKLGIAPKDEPTTATGKIIEGASQFGVGMVGAGKVLKGWSAATKAGRIGKAMAEGAIADFAAFDGHQARLSDMLAAVAPEQAKPIFEYLASNQEDDEIVGRLKNAVEGLGLGAAADGVIGGIRALKAARVAKGEARAQARAEGLQVDPAAEAAAMSEQASETAKAVKEALGDPRSPLVAKVKANEGVGGGSTQGAAKVVTSSTVEPNPFGINFARIETPDDVKAVISTLTERFAGDVEGARRGVQSWKKTQEKAGRLDWVSAMAQRKTGDAVNAETALAFREALNASATRLLELARKVQAEPSVANQYAFRKMMGVHRAIQLEFMGARAESGRALNAFKIAAGTPERNLRQIDSLLADAGGANAAQDMAKRLLKVAEKGDAALNGFVAQGAMARSRALIKLAYTNSLLTALGTPVRNVMGNTSALLLNVTSHAVSPRLARALGGETNTQVGEAAAMVAGYLGAVRDVFRLNPKQAWGEITENGAEALRRDGLFRGAAPGLDGAAPAGIRLRAEREEAGAAIGESMTSRPLSAAAWGVDEDTSLGRFLDVLQMVVEAPSNLNQTADDFFKVIAARGSLHAQAFRQATKEFADGAGASSAQIKARIQELVDSPTDAMLEAAEREMHELTFTRKTPGIAEGASKVRAAMDSRGPIPFGSMVMPFLRTPANLISMGMRYSPLAPFMKRFADDLAEGGAKAEIAKAQVAIGTAFWSLWLGMAADGTLTGNGPGSRQQKEALMREDEFGGVQWQPNAVKVGERWVSVAGVDPISTSILMAANMGELASNGDWDDERDQDFGEVSAHAISAIGQAFFNKSMLQSALDTASALTSGDATEAELLLKGRASALVPASGALRAFRRGEDPYLRETSGVIEAMKNTVPGLSDDLPMQRDLWGRPRKYQSGLGTVYDVVAPVQTKAAGGSAIDLEILKQGVSVSMPAKTIPVDGVDVSLKNRLDIWSEFVRLAGEPAYQQLEAVVSGGHEDSAFYETLSDGPDGEKAAYIKDVITAYRRDARAQVLDRYGADLEAMAADKARRRDQARAGAQ